jgi:hypothetical protein
MATHRLVLSGHAPKSPGGGLPHWRGRRLLQLRAVIAWGAQANEVAACSL